MNAWTTKAPTHWATLSWSSTNGAGTALLPHILQAKVVRSADPTPKWQPIYLRTSAARRPTPPPMLPVPFLLTVYSFTLGGPSVNVASPCGTAAPLATALPHALACLRPHAATPRASPLLAKAPTGRPSRDSRSASSANSGKLALAMLALWALAHAAPLFVDVPAAVAAEIPSTLAALPSPLLGLLFPPSDGSPPSPEEILIFDAIAFVGGPLTLLSGAFFRIVNGSERPGFEKDPIVTFLGGPEVVRAGKARIREEGFTALFDPSLFRP
jgi:hypothetical protein